MVLLIKALSSFSEVICVFNDPGPQWDHAQQPFHASVGQLIFDSGGNFTKIVPEHKAVTLQLS